MLIISDRFSLPLFIHFAGTFDLADFQLPCLSKPNRWHSSSFFNLKLSYWKSWKFTLWLFNIAMENGPFIEDLSWFTYQKWWFSSSLRSITKRCCLCPSAGCSLNDSILVPPTSFFSPVPPWDVGQSWRRRLLLQLEPSSAVKPFNRDFFGDVGRFFFVFSASRSQPKRNIGWVNWNYRKSEMSNRNTIFQKLFWDVSSLASSTISGFRSHGYLVDILDPLDQDIFKSRLLLKNVSMGQNPGTPGE